MALKSTAALQPDGTEREFQVIVDDQDLFRLDTEEMGRLTDGLAAYVHESLWFQDADLPCTASDLRPDSMKFLLPRGVDMHIITDQPAGIVPCAFILPAGVAEKYKKFYHNVHQYTEIATGRQRVLHVLPVAVSIRSRLYVRIGLLRSWFS